MGIPTNSAAAGPSNSELIRRLFGLAWRYRLRCVQVLGIQLVLLTMGLFGLSFTGIGIDYIRQVVGHRASDPTPVKPVHFLHVAFPADMHPMQVLGILGGMILVLAGCRAVLNYVYAVKVNILVQQKLVVDLRSEIYDKLQRLSFRFFDANTTGSIITRVTGDVQSVQDVRGPGPDPERDHGDLAHRVRHLHGEPEPRPHARLPRDDPGPLDPLRRILAQDPARVRREPERWSRRWCSTWPRASRGWR